MNSKEHSKKTLSQREIDDLVVAEADNDAAWEPPVTVKPLIPTSFSIPADLAGRAAFLARIHRIVAVEEWLTRIIRERIEIEEIAFAEAKREISATRDRP